MHWECDYATTDDVEVDTQCRRFCRRESDFALQTLVEGRAAKTELVRIVLQRIVLAFLFHKYSKVVVKNFITTPVVVKNFITTSPLRHRQRGNMTRPPVPKPPATTTYSRECVVYWYLIQ